MGMNLVGRNNERASFDCSVWSWRVICALVERVNAGHSLGIDMHGWQFNDGAGLDSHYASSRLADALELAMRELGDVITLDALPSGTLVEQVLLPAELKDYRLNKSTLVEFVEFLRECGGFRIY